MIIESGLQLLNKNTGVKKTVDRLINSNGWTMLCASTDINSNRIRVFFTDGTSTLLCNIPDLYTKELWREEDLVS